MKIYITGDCHGSIARFQTFAQMHPDPAAIIILGDAGFNYYLDNRDDELKDKIHKLPFTFYLVKGNHEARPEILPGIEEIYDAEMQGTVRYQPRWPQIKYLIDGETYTIEGLHTLVIGGAYSADKLYRIAMGQHWFADEQLSDDERNAISNKVRLNPNYDLILSHTCPLDWEPTDLFIRGIDESTVDQTMEKWLNEIKDAANWKIWLFGHFHADRLERPGVEMFYRDIVALHDIVVIETTPDGKYYLNESPNYYWK